MKVKDYLVIFPCCKKDHEFLFGIRLNMPNNSELQLDLNFLVDVAQQKIEECMPFIEVSISDFTIYISSKKVDFTPLEWALYSNQKKIPT